MNVTRILVTGFESYPGIAHNISADVAQACENFEFAEQNAKIKSVVLKTLWSHATRDITDEFETFDPEICLMLGIDPKNVGIRLETTAFNFQRGADVNDEIPSSSFIVKNGSGNLTTSVPTGEIFEALQANKFPCSISNDPGRYLCNAIYYKAMSEAVAKHVDCQCLFLHLPLFLNEQTISLKDTLEALQLIIATLVRAKANRK